MKQYRVHPESPTRVAMKVYNGPEPDNRWVDLVRGHYITEDDVKDWIRLVPVVGPDADSVAQVRTWREATSPFAKGPEEREIEIIMQDGASGRL